MVVAPAGVGNGTVSVGSASMQYYRTAPVISSITPKLVPVGSSSSITLTGSIELTAAIGVTNASDWSVAMDGSPVTATALAPTSIVVEHQFGTTAGAVTVTASAGGSAMTVSATLRAEESSPPVQMTVKGDISTFDVSAFKTKLASLMGLADSSQLFIESVTAGSVVVKFRVLSSPAQPNAATTAQSTLEKLASDGSLSKELGVTNLSIGGKTVKVEEKKGSSVPTGLIVGVVLGVGGGLLVVVGIVYYFRRANRRKVERKQQEMRAASGQADVTRAIV